MCQVVLQIQLEPRRMSHRLGMPVIERGSHGAVDVATQVAGASYVDVRKADTTHESVKLTHESAGHVLGMRTVKHEWGVNCDWVVNKCTYWCIYNICHAL